MSLGVAILIIGLIVLLIVSPAFRIVAAVALGVLIVALLFLAVWYTENQSAEKRKRDAAKTLIKNNQIELVDPRVSFSAYDGRPEKMTGRIRNNSTYTLQGLEVKLVFQDCLPKAQCDTVGEVHEVIDADVPPGQSRDFEEYLSGASMSPKGQIAWTFQMLSVSAKVD